MRVLYFHQHFSTPAGAAGIRSYEMARALIARGHQVTMVCGSYSGGSSGLAGEFEHGRRRGQVEGIDVIEFDLPYANNTGILKRTFLFLKYAFRSIKLIFFEKYDLVFATSTPLTAGIPGIFARWILRKPFVFEVRDLWPELPRAMGVIRNPVALGLMSVLEWVSYRSADRLIGLAPGIVEGIAKRGILRERVALIPNGCDLGIFGSCSNPWRPEGVAEDDLLAIFTGTHGKANGLDAVLDTASVLKRRGRFDIKLLLIGQGGLKASLQARAANEELSNVIFHTPINKDKLSRLMAGADIGMQLLANVPAFYYGTSPNKFFDYISAGLPVLNNYPGWLAEMILQEKCGFVVRPDDPEAFADALEHAADNRSELLNMGANARRLAVSKFNRSALSEHFVDWLEATRGA